MKKMLKILISVLVVASVLLTAVPSYAALQYKYTAYIDGTYEQSRARQMLQMINDFRVENGVEPLTYNYWLEEDAIIRSAEASAMYSHTRPNGKGFSVRCSDAENLAGANRYMINEHSGVRTAEEYETYKEDVDDKLYDVHFAFDAWSYSDGHRKNMLNPEYHSVAFSCFVYNERGDEVWIQEFSRPRLDENSESYIASYTEPYDEKTTVSFEIVSSNLDDIKFSSSVDNIELEFSKSVDLPKVLTNKDYYFDYTWTVDDESVAEIIDNKLVAKSVGTTTMTSTLLKGADRQTVTVPITVSQANIENAELELEYDSAQYDKSAKEPMVKSLTLNGYELGADDYNVEYSNNIEIGTAMVTIVGKGNYTGSLSKTFEIACEHEKFAKVIPGKVATCTDTGLTDGSECSMCGAVITEQQIIPMTEHTYKAVQTIDPTCKEKGYTTYQCSVCEGFYNEDISNEGVAHSYTEVEQVEPTCNAQGYIKYQCDVCDELYYEYISNENAPHNPIEAERIEPTCVSVGRTSGVICADCGAVISGCEEIEMIEHSKKTVTTKATKTANGSIVESCVVCHKVFSSSTIYKPTTYTISTSTYTYNGKVKNPSITIKDSKGNTLKKGTDYTLTAPSGRKNVGTYKYTIKFIGKYSGTATKSFKINPVKTSLKSITALKKGFKITWTKKTTQVTGYQIQYSTNKSFKNAKTVTVSSNKTTSKSISKLTAKKKYYVRIRTYKTVSGTKYYSAWSSYKSITTKK